VRNAMMLSCSVRQPLYVWPAFACWVNNRYSAGVAVASVFVVFWAGMRVGKARKLYNVPYPQVIRFLTPCEVIASCANNKLQCANNKNASCLLTQMYAERNQEHAKEFNCMQRAHQVSLSLKAHQSRSLFNLQHDLKIFMRASCMLVMS
jgi:hypothetical protein